MDGGSDIGGAFGSRSFGNEADTPTGNDDFPHAIFTRDARESGQKASRKAKEASQLPTAPLSSGPLSPGPLRGMLKRPATTALPSEAADSAPLTLDTPLAPPQTLDAPIPDETPLPLEMSEILPPTAETAPSAEATPAEPALAPPLRFAAIGSLVWISLVVAVAIFTGTTTPLTTPLLQKLAWLSMTIAGPCAVLWIGAMALLRAQNAPFDAPARTADRAASRFSKASARLRDDLAALDGAMDICETRLQSLKASAREDIDQLLSVGEKIEESVSRASAALASSMAQAAIATADLSRTTEALAAATRSAETTLSALPQLVQPALLQVEELRQSLGQLGEDSAARTQNLRQVQDDLLERAAQVQTQVSAIEQGARAAVANVEAAVQTLNEQVAQLDTQTSQVEQRNQTAVQTLTSQTETLLERVAATATATQNSIDAQAEALDAAFARLGAQTALIQEAWRGGQKHIDSIALTMADTASDVSTRLDTLAGQLDTLAPALAVGQSAADSLTERLNEASLLAQRCDSTARETSSHLTATAPIAQTLLHHIDEVRHAGEDAVTALGVAQARLSEQHQQFVDETEALVTRSAQWPLTLATANEALIFSHETARTATLEATEQMRDALTRVRSASQETSSLLTDQSHTLLQDVREAFARLDITTLLPDVLTPITQALDQLASRSQAQVDAARTAAEQLQQQGVALDEAADKLAQRLSDHSTQIRAEGGRDLARTSSHLLNALQSEAFDVVKLVGVDISDVEWSAYLNGDRSLFVRRAVRLLDKESRARVQKLYRSNTDFRDHVRRYVRDFEKLITRMTDDPDGEQLCLALLSSDHGKLYVALAQGIDRLI